jgi:signal transduction histidine kinase/ligand-binding sensor domain-containing protein
MLTPLVNPARYSRWRVFTVTICAIFSSTQVLGDIPTPTVVPFSNQYHSSWRVRDGSPPQIVDIAQTNDGFLWVASQAGLYRFDGVKFEPFVSTPGNSLLNDAVISLAATRDGGLWLGYQFGGASLIKKGVVTNYSPDATFKHNLLGLVEDLDGAIWGATHFGLQRFDGIRWTRIGEDWNFPLKALDELFLDAQGTLWAGTHDSYYALRRGEKRFYDSGIKSGPLHITSERTGWMAENSSLTRLSRSVEGSWVRANTGVRGDIEALATTNDGHLWIATDNGILRTETDPSRDSVIERFRQEDGLSGSFVFRLIQDRESNVWAISGGGLDQFRQVPFNRVLLPAGIGGLRMVSLGDAVLVASGVRGNSTLFRVDDKGVELVPSPLTRVYTMAADHRGGAWINADGGMWHYTDNAVKPLNSQPPGVDNLNANVSSMTVDASDALWISLIGDRTQRLYKFKDGTWSEVRDLPIRDKPDATSMMTDHLGNVWIGFRDHQLIKTNGISSKAYTQADGLNVGIITSLFEHDDHIWIGGTEGIAYLQDGRVKKVLMNNTAASKSSTSGIVELANGDIWLNSVAGVVEIQRVEAAAALRDSAYQAKARVFTYLDGINGSTSNIVFGADSLQTTNDGTLYVNTYGEILRINPDQIAKNTIAPEVRISSVTVDDHLFAPANTAVLTKGSQNLQIDYSASSLSIPERVQFRYKLEGFDTDWQNAGTRRQAFYSRLPPRHYVFRVAASNNDGIWSTADATWDVDLPPTFLQSIWFKLMCVAAGALLLAGLYFFRVGQLTAQVRRSLLVRIAERERIARDLHDTFFQGVQGLFLRFNTGTSKLHPDDPARELFMEALQQSDRVMAEGREMVLDLRADEPATSDLGGVFLRGGEALKSSDPVDYKVVVTGQPRELLPLCATELSRIGKEALHNAFCHSKARTIECEIAYAKDVLTLRIRDDGVGIDADVLRGGRRQGHLGLPGMKERAERVGAKFSIWSQKNSGSEIEVLVPAAVAYASSNLLAARNGLWKWMQRPG